MDKQRRLSLKKGYGDYMTIFYVATTTNETINGYVTVSNSTTDLGIEQHIAWDIEDEHPEWYEEIETITELHIVICEERRGYKVRLNGATVDLDEITLHYKDTYNGEVIRYEM